MKNLAAGLLVLIFCFSAAQTSFAVMTGASNDAALSDEVIDQRIGFIEERLDSYKFHGQVWYWSWMAINGGSLVGNAIAASNADETDNRVNYIGQSTLGAIGVADLVFRPLHARHGADPIRDLPQSTREEKLAKLHAAENLFHATAERAAERHDWTKHLANLLLNTAAGAATAIAGDTGQGAVTALTGTLGGEVFILTQPAAPEKDWEAYQRMVSGRASRGTQVSVVPHGTGFLIQIRW